MTVYFARTSDEVRVGYTPQDDPFDREGALQEEKASRVAIIGYVPGPRELGEHFLTALVAYRTQGTWHQAVPAVLTYVRDVLRDTQGGVVEAPEALEPKYDPDATFQRLMRAAGAEAPAVAPTTLEEPPAVLEKDDAPEPPVGEPETALAVLDDTPPTELAETPDPTTLAQTMPEVVQRAEALAEKPQSASTRRNYRHASKQWLAWCKEYKQSPLPADERALCAFLAQMATAGRSVATLQLTYYAIRAAHKRAGQPLGALSKVSALFANLERERANLRAKPWRGKDPLRLNSLSTGILASEPKTIREFRDRAVLLIGFTSALRRSALTALDVSDFEFADDGGIRLTVRKDKRDQQGKGRVVWILKATDVRLCPVRAIKAWWAAAKITEGPAFRRLHQVIGKDYVSKQAMSDATVSSIVKKFVGSQGLDRREFAAHSLRSGCVTEAYNNGASTFDIMATTGHTDERTVRSYIRNVEPSRKAIKFF